MGKILHFGDFPKDLSSSSGKFNTLFAFSSPICFGSFHGLLCTVRGDAQRAEFQFPLNNYLTRETMANDTIKSSR